MSESDQISWLALKYLQAKNHVLDRGFYDEIEYYDSVCFEDIDEHVFIREIAWVILSSGMNEKVIRSKFSDISEAFMNWSIICICNNSERCREKALSIFNNEKKIDAIIKNCFIVYTIGINEIKNYILNDGISYLASFPYIGNVTAYHVAKNLGINCAKPDRHMARIANTCGYNSPDALCHEISQIVGDQEKIIDLILWRYATINTNYLYFFSN